MERRLILRRGVQVRKEAFGLLFYAMEGPRLYFLSSGSLLEPSFFDGEHSLRKWLESKAQGHPLEESVDSLERALDYLKDKGVIRER